MDMKRIFERRSEPGSFLDSFLILAIALAVVSLLVREFVEADTWWHVAIGRDIIEKLAVPRVDHFAAAAIGRPYHDSHWLFQVVLAMADKAGGLKAVGAVTIAVWAVTLAFCYRALRTSASPAVSALLLFIATMACSYRFIPRPDIVTCLMLVLFYHLLQTKRYRTFSGLAFFGVLQVIWSNSHGLFVLGPFMAGCYLFASWHDRLKKGDSDFLPLARLLVLLLLASICTPFGTGGWQYALQLAQEAGPTAHLLYRNLNELVPTFGAQNISNPDFWSFFLLVAAFATTSLLLAIRRQLPLSRFLICAALLVAACSGRRNMPLFALTAAPLVAESLGILRRSFSFSELGKAVMAIIFLAFSWLPISGRFYQFLGQRQIHFGLGPASGAFPEKFPGFLRQSGFNGQIYNTDLLGGYCLYHGILPLVDGRWEVYDRDTLITILRSPFDQEAWEWVVSRYHIIGLLLENGSEEAMAIVPSLSRDDRFRLVYADAVVSFWLKEEEVPLPSRH